MDGQTAYNLLVIFLGALCAGLFVLGIKSGNL